MAGQTTGKVPRIRFKADSEPWADEKIGDVLAETRRPIVLEDDQRYELITVKRRNEGVISRGHLLGRDILVKNYAELKAGDFVISKRQVVHGATGIVPPALDGAIVSNEYLTAVDSEKLLTEFLTIVASLPAMRRKFFLSSYGVDIEKLFFDVDDWKKRSAMLPDVQVQRRIGQFFRKLDQLISLHHHKHDKLVALRKAMLQKMLPRPGAPTPEIRFNGFSGGWIEVPLSELTSKIGSGKTPRGGSTSYISQGIPLIRSQNIFDDRVHLLCCAHISSETDKEMANSRVTEGDVLLNITGASIGRSAVYLGKRLANVNQHVCIIRANSCFDPQFIQLHLSSDSGQRKISNSQAGGAREGLNFQQIGGFIFPYPDIDEQKKIGAYFRNLNELLLKHATQIKKLQQVKSAYLEEMLA